ncbi:fimbrial protein [Enterobacter cloacae]|uniref:fimbrial protein n=1 Tax=Enterobacter cloacae TaxID=550 RepID=UPI00334FFD5F
MIKKRAILLSAVLTALLCTESGLPGAKATVLTVKVTVLAGPCKINNNNPIDVDFGDDMLTTRVDGNNYLKTINYTLDCSEAKNDALKMQISGDVAPFDKNILRTPEASNADNLGIKLLHNGTSWPLNDWFNFKKGEHPVLQAVPVKAPGSTLKAGTFSASATLTVDYQ